MMRLCSGFILLSMLFAVRVTAEQLEMRNGDRYSGKVLSMTADSIVLQSDILGKITVPRGLVSNIRMAPIAATSPSAPAATNGFPTATALQQLGQDTNAVERIRKQFLANAGPEANAKFDSLMGDLVAGKFDTTQLRSEAQKSADQLREMKRESGSLDPQLDSYLGILDSFLKQSSSNPAGTGVPTATTNGTNGITIIH